MTNHDANLANDTCLPKVAHAMSLDMIYRSHHERIDHELIRLQGLISAMESVIETHPHLRGPEVETQAVYSTLYAMKDKVELALQAQTEGWAEMRGKL